MENQLEEAYEFFKEHEAEIEKIQNENKPSYVESEFALVDLHETQTSRILECLFKYKKDDKYVVLESFIENYLVEIDEKREIKVNSPTIEREKRYENKDKKDDIIDLLIRDEGYAIIFENKLKGAKFQPHQLARYIKKLKEKEKKIFIVIIPAPSHDNCMGTQSTWRLPKNDICDCRCDKEQDKCNVECTSYYDSYEKSTIVLRRDFVDWLRDLIENRNLIEDKTLTSLIEHFIDYLEYLNCGRINKKLTMKIKEYLEKDFSENGSFDEAKFKRLAELSKGMKDLKKELAKAIIKEWYRKLEDTWKTFGLVLENEGQSLGIKIEGDLWIGCWSGYNKKGEEFSLTPFWGVYLSKEKEIKNAKEIVEKIRCCGITGDTDNIAPWLIRGTVDCFENCERLFKKAKEEGLIKKV